MIAGKFMWKKEPFAALSFYIGLVVPIAAPIDAPEAAPPTVPAVAPAELMRMPPIFFKFCS